MKKILALFLALTLIFTLVACNNGKNGYYEKNTNNLTDQIDAPKNNEIVLTFKEIGNIVSATETTLFVVNPDKTVSVAGKNNGNCEVLNWTNIEKIFATHNATYGLQSDGTCLVSSNYTSSEKAEYNNAIKITNSYVLLSNGKIISRIGEELPSEVLPHSIDIIEDDGGRIICLTKEGNVNYYGEGSTSKYENINNHLKNWKNIKEINFSSRASHGKFSYYITGVTTDGKVHTLRYSYDDFGDSRAIEPNCAAQTWNQSTSAIPLNNNIFLSITTDNNIIGCGGVFDEFGANTPKILTSDKPLRLFTIKSEYTTYAILICNDSSVVVYSPNARTHNNIESAFSKWKSFSIS